MSGRVALITGASRGIGRAVAHRFAAEGADLVLPARNSSQAAELERALAPVGGKVLTLTGDLSERPFFSRLAQAVEEKFGRLDILIANAGVLGPLKPLAQIDEVNWDEALDVNVSANYRLLRAFDPMLRKAKAARIVFVTSGITRNPSRPNLGSYAVAKCALEALAKTYAAETSGTAIRINLLNPGPTRTEMRACVCPEEDPLSVKPPETAAEFFVELCLPECPYSADVVDLMLVDPNGTSCRAEPRR